MSTMSVYSQNEVKIGNNTETLPDNHYGKSKSEAEQSILKLSDSKFLISIIRPPMVYGKDQKVIITFYLISLKELNFVLFLTILEV